MDETQDQKQRARTLEQQGDPNGALAIYQRIPGAAEDAGLLARIGLLQARAGDVGAAVESHRRAADLLLEAGLRNAALALHRRLLRLVPDEVESRLQAGTLAAAAGYLNDAAEALLSYLEAAGPDADGGAVGDAVAGAPAGVQVQLAERVRPALAAVDPAAAGRLDRDLGPAPSGGEQPEDAGAESGDLDILPSYSSQPSGEPGLMPTSFAALQDPADSVAPVEGLQAHGAEAVEPERTPPDVETSPEPVELGVSGFERWDEQEEAEELPLLGLDAQIGLETQEPAAAPPEGVHDWVDLGALVLGTGEGEGEGDRPRPTAPRGQPEDGRTLAAGEDFSELLEELGVGGASRTTVEDASAYDLGLAYKEMGLLDEAIAQLQTALVGSGNPLATLEVLGECYMERGEPERACTVLRRAAGLRGAAEEELVGVQYLLGRCEEELGRHEEARASYGRVVAVEPDFRDASARLQRL
jgi:tetratricopeptide (TPR) repeat protein